MMEAACGGRSRFSREAGADCGLGGRRFRKNGHRGIVFFAGMRTPSRATDKITIEDFSNGLWIFPHSREADCDSIRRRAACTGSNEADWRSIAGKFQISKGNADLSGGRSIHRPDRTMRGVDLLRAAFTQQPPAGDDQLGRARLGDFLRGQVAGEDGPVVQEE
jgi:hypothetical protein